jgi:hypothetical protein
MSKKLFFTPEDFANLIHPLDESPYKAYARRANEKLKQLIESWPVVYGAFDGEKVTQTFGQIKSISDTHSARLAFIEEIVKEPCKHEASWSKLRTSLSVDRFHNRFADVTSICMNCGVELKATWEAAE